MRLEIIGKAVDVFLKYILVKTPSDFRHPLGNRHHGADRRAAAGPTLPPDVGLSEFSKRGRDIARGVEIEYELAAFERLFLDDRLEQPVLVGEVDVERAFGDAGRARDFVHAGAVKTEIHENLASAVQNLPALRRILFGGEMNRVWSGCNHWFIFSRKISTRDTGGKGFSLYGPDG